jgi:hypothetical protein
MLHDRSCAFCCKPSASERKSKPPADLDDWLSKERHLKVHRLHTDKSDERAFGPQLGCEEAKTFLMIAPLEVSGFIIALSSC